MQLILGSRASTFIKKSPMKKIIILICLFFSSKAFSQESAFKKGSQLDQKHFITAVDSNESYIWLGTKTCLVRVSKKTGKKSFYTLSVTGHDDNYVTSLFCLSDGCVWIGTNHGLIKYDVYGFILYSNENTNLPEDFIISLGGTDNEDLLVGTAHHGVLRMHRSHFHKTTNELGAAMHTTTKALKLNVSQGNSNVFCGH
jgi:ligand-binding sensor domain-containing protein